MKSLRIVIIVLVVVVLAVVGISFYMLDYSLAPNPDRMNTSLVYQQLYDDYPECREWVDSLQAYNAIRDTFLIMPSGERHHALFIDGRSGCTAVVIHGWRDCAVEFLWLARIYERCLGYNVLLPDLHACGLSEGSAIQMGWKDRLDVMRWMEAFVTDTMVVHGVSMGAATAMILSNEQMPSGIKDVRFVEDCGYTSVWDEFADQLHEQFSLPPFPLMYTTSMLCKLCYGWSFSEASPLGAVRNCHYPMLFIHGSNDTFVPTNMVYALYQAKPGNKQLWVAEGSEHARSYKDHKADYIERVRDFCRSEIRDFAE